jgi:hypothetical protein
MKRLEEITGKNPFKVPENYFEDVNRKIIAATVGSDNGIKKAGLYDRIRPYLLIAASVTGLILISYAAIKLLIPANSGTSDTVALYSSDFDSYVDDIDIGSLEENSATIILSDESPEMNKNEIIENLLQENIEISEIYERL